MEKARKTRIISDFCEIAWEMHYLAAGYIAEDDMDGLEKKLLEIVDCQAKFIIMMIYLFQNCKEHQANRIAYYSREYSTHSYYCTTQAFLIEEAMMWKEFGNEECILELFNRLRIAKKNGKVSEDFDIAKYIEAS